MDGVDDELTTTLKLLADLLKKSAGDDLKALMAGDLKLAIVPKNWKPVLHS